MIKKLKIYLKQKYFTYFLYFIFENIFSFLENKKYYVFNFNIFFKFFSYCIIFDKLNKEFLVVHINNVYDLITIRNIFLKNEYSLKTIKNFKKNNLNLNDKKKLIIDAGANIGCTSLYFCKEFPGCKVLAIESDIKNFKMLKKNTHKQDISVINKALYGSVVSYETVSSVDGRAKSISINKDYKNSHLHSITLDSIIEMYSEKDYNYFLIKIDIEGSEKSLFDQKNISILNKFKFIIIELHDKFKINSGISDSFFKGLYHNSSIKREILIHGENFLVINNINDEK